MTNDECREQICARVKEAWDGDGVSCVTQMVMEAYRQRDYWKERALKAEANLCKCPK